MIRHCSKVCIRAKWPIRPQLIPVSVAWSDWEYFYSPLDGMLVHRRVTPSIKFAGTHLYTWVERSTVGVKCLAQEHNTMSPARARTRTARSGVERTNHEATAPPCWFACHHINLVFNTFFAFHGRTYTLSERDKRRQLVTTFQNPKT